MRRWTVGLTVILAAAVSACDQGTNPELATLDEVQVAQFAELVSESAEVRLPSLGALLRAAREAIDAQGGNEEAVAHFRQARRLASAAEDAREAGDLAEAASLARQSHRQRLQGIVAALGPEAVAEAVAGSAAGLERLQSHLEGRVVPERVTRAVARIAAAMTSARQAQESGQLTVALHHALAAAEGIRNLSPRYVAARWIHRATEMLRAARQAVGDAPTDDEATALRRAGRLLNVARDAFDAGDMAGAVAAAMRSAELSWGVVEGRAE